METFAGIIILIIVVLFGSSSIWLAYKRDKRRKAERNEQHAKDDE